jgi:hypothetical protein
MTLDLDIKLSPLLAPLLEPFPFAGFGKINSVCGVLILRHAKPVIVVLSEMPNNPGTSVTNRAEAIATLVRAKYLGTHLDPSAIRWIEHYPPGRGIDKDESFDWISFTWHPDINIYTDPKWRRLDKNDMELVRDELTQVVA